ncbi:ATP synthase F1 subunit epsilon [Microvirga flavescens]|uniref:ATP synthase F1 subunit epsilon n=1 Tax=Microvirga flavescens TaxID=2249811 RepID=UPI000DDBD02D|nr:ATP synthase F1 subunit epsilon [Microvirga flavescens]
MADIMFELVSPERVIFSGVVRAVMLPAIAGDMTIMAGHEPTIAGLQSGFITVTDVREHGHRAFIRGGFAEITGESVTVLADWVLPPDELTRERLHEEVVRLETLREVTRDDISRRDLDFALSRLKQMRVTLSF